MKPLKPSRNEEEYDEALREIEPFFCSEPEPDTPETDHFEILAMLIQNYEAPLLYGRQLSFVVPEKLVSQSVNCKFGILLAGN
jgi:antitoxin component HigA of HigAB toxin-antitoxin module